jgi:hypothetical protein
MTKMIFWRGKEELFLGVVRKVLRKEKRRRRRKRTTQFNNTIHPLNTTTCFFEVQNNFLQNETLLFPSFVGKRRLVFGATFTRTTKSVSVVRVCACVCARVFFVRLGRAHQ